MKPEFEKIIDGIYRLCVPFDGNIYTTVFALVCERGIIIVDSGSNEFDATNYVIRFLLYSAAVDMQSLPMLSMIC